MLRLILFPTLSLAADQYAAQIAGTGAVKQMDEFLGFNHNQLNHETWTPDLAKAACDAGLPLLKYPGGTVSAYWDWHDGWVITPEDYKTRFPQSKSYKYKSRADQNPNRTKLYTLESLKGLLDLCERMQMKRTVNFALNMVTRELDDQLQMLQAADNLGVAIKIVELGNEYYASAEPDFVARFPTAEVYAANASVWAAAIK
jgi:hypothetical protein